MPATPQALFYGEQGESFTQVLAKKAAQDRAEKTAVVKDIQAKISAKDIYAPYQQAADQILLNAVDSLSKEQKVNNRAITDAVSEYAKYQNYSNKVKDFLTATEASYKADKEVIEGTALQAIRKKYAATGRLDELEKLVTEGIDAEQVLIETPNALREDVVVKNRLSNLGKVITDLSTSGQLRHLSRYFDGMTDTQIKQIVNQAIEVDAKGNPLIKDIAALDRLGITDALLGDNRMKTLVDARLEKNKLEVSEDNRKEELRRMLQPYASAETISKSETKTFDNPAWKESIENKQLALARQRLAQEGKTDTASANLLAQSVAFSLAQSNDKFKEDGTLKQSPAVTKVFSSPEFKKNAQGQTIDAEGNPTTDPSKMVRAKSPAGIGFFGQNELFKGKSTDEYLFGRTLIDKLGNRYLEAFPKNAATKLPESMPEYIQLEAPVLEGVLPDSKDRSAFQSLMADFQYGVPKQRERQPYKPKKFDAGLKKPETKGKDKIGLGFN